MSLLSRKADYALLILSYLYHRPEGGNARAIAERFQLSRPFVANILKDLCHKGIVTSHRGVKGGYSLHPDAKGASLASLLTAIEEGFSLTVCTSSNPRDESCTLATLCPIKLPLAEIHRRMIDVLQNVTLAELFRTTESPIEGTLTQLPVLTQLGCESSGDPLPSVC